MAAAPRTLGDWLRWAERQYARRRVALGQVAATAHDEALYLLLHAAGLPLDSPAETLTILPPEMPMFLMPSNPVSGSRTRPPFSAVFSVGLTAEG